MTKAELKADWKQRNTYHPPTTEQQRQNHERVTAIIQVAGDELIEVCPNSRELSTALTQLTLVRMLANAALAVHDNAECLKTPHEETTSNASSE